MPGTLGGLRADFTCHNCTGLGYLKEVRDRVESFKPQSSTDAINLFNFEGLTGSLQEITSLIEGGLGQMTEVLESIDATLKTPSKTQANEWRQIAKELRGRGVLDQSEKFFLKSLETNPLDYRAYIGLGKTYLQMGNAEQARTYWEKSFPHAPKKGMFDFKSYSYRLVGRLYFCQGNYQQAVLALRRAIELSPYYYLGHYEHAQYCVLTGDQKNCISSLAILIREPFLFQLVKRNSEVFGKENRKEIENLLKTVDGFTDDDVFHIVVDYYKQLGYMIKSGHYDWIAQGIDPAISDSIAEKYFLAEGLNRVELNVGFVCSKGRKSDDIIQDMENRSLRLATLPELLAFGAAYPNKQKEFTILASDWEGHKGFHHFVCLEYLDSERRLNEGKLCEFDYHPEWRFLAVRK
ncbi:MAG TPA: tetratricopeptide repeat protein [Candidatus Paceibacterota bacterium]|nr:tetratricopeptide repeat protein [Candidatus Paceibacterota bacterium]